MITKQFIIQIKCYGDERAWRSVESHAVECSNDTLRGLKNAYLSCDNVTALRVTQYGGHEYVYVKDRFGGITAYRDGVWTDYRESDV